MFFGDTYYNFTDEMASFQIVNPTTVRITYKLPPFVTSKELPRTQELVGTPEQVESFKVAMLRLSELYALRIKHDALELERKIERLKSTRRLRDAD